MLSVAICFGLRKSSPRSKRRLPVRRHSRHWPSSRKAWRQHSSRYS